MGKLRYLFYKRWLTPMQRYRFRCALKVRKRGIENIHKLISSMEWVLYEQRMRNGDWISHSYARMDVLKMVGDLESKRYDDEWWELFRMERPYGNLR